MTTVRATDEELVNRVPALSAGEKPDLCYFSHTTRDQGFVGPGGPPGEEDGVGSNSRRRLHQRAALIALGCLFLLYLAFVFVPGIASTRLLGLQGKYLDERLEVVRVLSGSPADLAGVRRGDLVVRMDSMPVSEWWRRYHADFSAYADSLHAWRSSPVQMAVEREGVLRQVVIAPRALRGGDYVRVFGIRTVFGLFLVGLFVVLLRSGMRGASAFTIGFTFVLALVWLFGGIRFWPSFMSPLIHDTTSMHFAAGLVVTTVALHLLTSTMMLVALQFPQYHPVYRRWPWLWVPVYVVPLLLLAVLLAAAEGPWMERLHGIYAPRLWINTTSLFIAVAILGTGYRHCTSPSQRERTRWVVGAMMVALISLLLLWDVPLVVSGTALVPDFDWLLLPAALVPAAMTMAMVSHRLFGVRGMIRRRMRALQRMVTREKVLVTRRDQRIRSLLDEMRQLESELERFTADELAPPDRDPGTEPRLQRLLERFPELAEIRETRLIGASPAWVDVFEQVAIASRDAAPVLIVGESGTGKSDSARAIHRLGERRDRVFRELSCSQFEHGDPSFALGRIFGIGAGHGLPNVPREGQKGLLEECDGGTLFLDDFDCLPRNVQDLLLYPLEGRPFEPGVGRGSPVTVSVRFILATNQDPDELVRRGALRADLLSRLGARVDIPPLRQRREDIAVLASHFLAECSEELGHRVSTMSPRAMNLLKTRDFSRGNVRELRAAIRTAVGRAMLEGDTTLRAGYFPDVPGTDPGAGDATVISSTPPAARSTLSGEISRELAVLRKYRFRIAPAEIELGFSSKSRTLSNYLRGICIRALAENGWDVAAAARAVAGDDDAEVLARLAGKIRRYLLNIAAGARSGDPRRLYNNLPAAYRPYLDAALARCREAH